MTTIRWTDQVIADLTAIRAFVQQDSPHYASVVVARLIRAVDRLKDFPKSGRAVPEFERSAVREIVERPYRIIYLSLVRDDEVDILTVHHGVTFAGESRGGRRLNFIACLQEPRKSCEHRAGHHGQLGLDVQARTRTRAIVRHLHHWVPPLDAAVSNVRWHTPRSHHGCERTI